MVTATKLQDFTYRPPLQLQSEDLKIWSLVISNSRQEKVSEYNYSRKSPFALHTWPEALAKFAKVRSNDGAANSPHKYADVMGIVSDKHIVIDVDHHPDNLPQYIQDLIKAYPTHCHKSKSGNGWKVYYQIDRPLSKKMVKHATGELFCGMFVTTTDPLLTDFTNEHVASITIEQLQEYIPEVNKQLKDRVISSRQASAGTSGQLQYIDLDKVLQEVQRMLDIIPIDPDSMLTIAYETRLKDMELNSYTHWLLVSHALADLAIQLSTEYPTARLKLQAMFHEWSAKGATYKNENDCDERFERSYKETQEADKPIVSFNTLRKIFWSYRIPLSDFPVVKFSGKGEDRVKVVDASDPENFEFLTQVLGLQLCQDYSRGYHYVRGPKSLIKAYFSDEQFYYITDGRDDLSRPFSSRIKSDDNLAFRLVKLFRHFGIRGTTKNSPLYAGFNKTGTKQIDVLYEWMTSKPWDKTPRVMGLLHKTVTLASELLPDDVTEEFYYHLIYKHLTHSAGLRAKANRSMNNALQVNDRFRKAQGVLILSGYQNTHKSTWIECLLPSQIGYVTNTSPSSVKDALEIQRALAGTFILNIDEFDAVLEKMDMSVLKNVITQDKDSFRTMYTQTFDDHPRAAGIFGTTNKTHLRLDKTGNRRFWIIPIKSCDAAPLITCDYQQFWAELLYKAEHMSIDDWSITEKEKLGINNTARMFAKQTVGDKTLEMAFTLDTGEFLLYDYMEFDFEKLFNNLSQKLQRTFVQERLLFPVQGNKAYLHLQNKFLMDGNISFSLGSFNYEIAAFTDNLLNLQNQTIAFDRLVYKEGVIYYNAGKAKPVQYHFLPYKETLNKLIHSGQLSPSLLKSWKKNM